MNRPSRRRRAKREEHLNHEAWAIPFADLLTLLLAFFVVMYAISSLNTGKYRVLADALSVAFKGGSVAEDAGPLRPSAVSGMTVLDAVEGREIGAPRRATGERSIVAAPEMLNAARIAMRVARAAAPMVMRDQVTVRQHPLWVEVEIRNDVLFASGSAELGPGAAEVLAGLADTLRGFGNPIRVEGHTDDVPIEGGRYRDNWDLSAARAASVVRVLADGGIDPRRLAVLGFAEHRPLQSNLTESGRRANRRVLLAILGSDDSAEGPYGRERGSRGTTSKAP
ncbi:MAG: flagellar motor protein MotB [Gammaproteobacteria bacterium]